MGIIKCNGISIDFESSCQQLASIWGKAKLDEAIASERFNGEKAPIEIEQMEYLMEEYYSSLGYFANHTEEFIKYLVDHE